MMRYAVIGTSKITEKFLSALERSKEGKLFAVYSRTEQRAEEFSKKYGIGSIYTDIKKLASSEEIDAVYIASPNCCHAEQAIILLKSGKHVLCEKPIASNYSELKEMYAAAREGKAVLIEAMRNIYSPGFAGIKENLSRLGKLRGATFPFCQYSSRYDNFKKGIIENIFKPELSNGALMDIGVYCVHEMVALFGKPVSVTAKATMLNGNIDGEGTIIADYGDMKAQIIYSKISNTFLPAEIRGEEGNLIIEDVQNPQRVTFISRKGEREELVFESSANNMIYEIEEHIRLIKENLTVNEYILNSLIEMEIMDEARRQIGLKYPADDK